MNILVLGAMSGTNEQDEVSDPVDEIESGDELVPVPQTAGETSKYW